MVSQEPSSSIEELNQLYDQLPEQVKLVYDQNDTYRKIIESLDQTIGRPEAITATMAAHERLSNQLSEVAKHISELPLTISGWTGKANESFTEHTRRSSVSLTKLSELTDETKQVLDTAVRATEAGERLILNLVRSSLNYSVSSLDKAQSIAGLTLGTSISTWASLNVVQANQLLKLVEQNTARVQTLIARLTVLLKEITETTLATAKELGANQ